MPPNEAPPAPEAPPKPELFSTVIPEEYRDKPYLKDFLTRETNPETYKELFKKLDGAETLIGKKTGVPAADAPEAEWDAFHAKLRPSKADDYEIKAGADADPEFIKTVRDAFFDAGATKGQASKIISKLQAAIGAQEAKAVEAQKALDAEFDALSKATFGPDNAKALAQASAMIKENCPPALAGHIDKLDNNSMVILAGILNAVHAKYGTEDSQTPDGANAGAVDTTALYAEGQKLQASAEYKDFQHPAHAATVDRVNAIFKEIAAKQKK